MMVNKEQFRLWADKVNWLLVDEQNMENSKVRTYGTSIVMTYVRCDGVSVGVVFCDGIYQCIIIGDDELGRNLN